MKTKETRNTQPQRDQYAELLTLATRSTQNALKQLAQNDEVIADLLREMVHDDNLINKEKIDYRAQTIAEELDEINSINYEVAESYKVERKVKSTQEQRDIARDKRERDQYERTDRRGHVNDLEKISINTLSDRQDCVQVWLSAYLYEIPTAREIDNVVSKMSKDYNGALLLLANKTINEIYEVARIRHAKNVVYKYVRSQSGLNALDTMKTITHTPTAKEVAQWLTSRAMWERYTIKGTTTRALELDSKNKPIFIDRYYTYKKATTIETEDEDGNVIYKHTNNSAIHNRADLETMQALSQCEKLTHRERRFIRLFGTLKAIKSGEQARKVYYKEYRESMKDKPSAFQKGLDNAHYNGRISYCLQALGIETRSQRDNFMSRLKARLVNWEPLDSLNSFTNDKLTAESIDHQTAIYMMESNRGTADSRTAETIDLVKWTATAPKKNRPQAITWLTKAQAEQRAEQMAEDKANRWQPLAEDFNIRAEQSATAYAEQHASDRPSKAQADVDNLRAEREKSRAEKDKERTARAEQERIAEQWAEDMARKYPPRATAPQQNSKPAIKKTYFDKYGTQKKNSK